MSAETAPPEFSRMVDLRQITAAPMQLAATEAERAALAARFGLVSLARLEASIALEPAGPVVSASGRLVAEWVQPCAVSGEDLAQSADEPVAFRFVPERTDHTPDEEIELTESELDEIEYAGTSFDVGEAVAQSLALAIDPFATGPGAEAARKTAGIVSEGEASPFAALKGLKLGKD
jgi:uncharacterized metal-binding protein YceD (DUF177 family)